MTDAARPSRRGALAARGLGSAAARAAPAFVPPLVSAARAHGFAPPVVLVHGAWRGAWSWSKLLHPLSDSGVMAAAVQLSGLGANAHRQAPEIGLNVHAQDLANHLRFNDIRGAVVVGHGYGGCVLSAALAQDTERRIAHAVFLDAAFLDDGEALADHLTPADRDAYEAAARDGALIPPPPDEVARGLGGPAAGLADWARDRLRPLSAGCFTEAQRGRPFRDGLRLSYLRCTRAAHPLQDRFLAKAQDDPRFSIRTLDAPHDVMRIDPALTRSALLASF